MVLYMKANIHFWSYLAHFFLEWEIFQAKVVDETKTRILCSVMFLQKPCRLWDNVEKCCRAGQTIDENMVHAHCMLGNRGYTRTLTIYIIYYFCTATMVARTRLNVTLHVHCPYCFLPFLNLSFLLPFMKTGRYIQNVYVVMIKDLGNWSQ